MNKKTILILSIVMFTLSMESCHHDKDLMTPNEESAFPCRIIVDWTDFQEKENPTGMTLLLFQKEDSFTTASIAGKSTILKSVFTETTNNTSWVDCYLMPGKYAAYVFNQSKAEFGSLEFGIIDDWNQSEVHAIEGTSKWFSSSEPIINNIEWIGVDADEDIYLTKEKLNTLGGQPIIIDTLKPKNIVYTISVYVHIKNINSLRSARAFIQGLAYEYMLGHNHPSETKATHIIEKWSIVKDSVSSDGVIQYGTIKAQIACLGFPLGHRGKPQDNILHLECLLKNDSIVTFDYKVGDKFQCVSNGKDNLNFTIDITMKDPLPYIPNEGDNTSTFEVTVEEWENEENVNISI